MDAIDPTGEILSIVSDRRAVIVYDDIYLEEVAQEQYDNDQAAYQAEFDAFEDNLDPARAMVVYSPPVYSPTSPVGPPPPTPEAPLEVWMMHYPESLDVWQFDPNTNHFTLIEEDADVDASYM